MFENLECGNNLLKNTNFGSCARNLKNAKALLFLPAGTKIPVSKLPTFIADTLVLLRADNKATRAQYITGIKGVTKANIANATQQWGDGTTVDTREERPGRTYQMDNLCAFKGLSTYNGRHDDYDVLIINSDGVVMGTHSVIDLTREAAVSGFDLARIFTTQYDETINETQAMFEFMIELADGAEWRNMVPFMPTDGNALKSLSGLQTVELEWVKPTTVVAGTYYLRAKASCGGVNMAALYMTELSAPGLWKFTNPLTVPETVITPAAVTCVNGLVKVDFTVGDANFVAATQIKASLALPSVLTAAMVSYYESDTVTFLK